MHSSIASRLLALPFLFLLATAATPAWATILLFDQARDAATQSIVVPTSSGATLPPDYGDNVTGASMAVPGGFFTYGEDGEGFTRNVTVGISAAGATPTDSRARLWQADYGDLINVVVGAGPGIEGAPMLDALFTAEPGFVVDLYGFELAGWPNADYTIASVSVLAGTDTLFFQSDVLVEGNATEPRHTTFAFATPLSAPEILLRLDLSNIPPSTQDNIGIDSIRFGQTPPIPEPKAGLLLLIGLAVTAMGRLNRLRSRGPSPHRRRD